MKLLEVPTFGALNALLEIDSVDLRVRGRVEAFSCKMVNADKKLYGEMEARSPSTAVLSISPMGFFLQEPTTAKTLSFLISTLNLSFPDYDFSNAQGHHFHKVTVEMATTSVNQALQEVLSNADKNKEEVGHGLSLEQFWAIIDKQVAIEDCDVYSYCPEPDSDPFQEEGYIWSFNYFFYNRKFKEIVFLTCSAVSNIHSPARQAVLLADSQEEFDLLDDVDGVFPQQYGDVVATPMELV